MSVVGLHVPAPLRSSRPGWRLSPGLSVAYPSGPSSPTVSITRPCSRAASARNAGDLPFFVGALVVVERQARVRV
jgi:hypothetical protein